MNQFRIGGVYRTAGGELATITAIDGEFLHGHTCGQPIGRQTWKRDGGYWNGVGRIKEKSLTPSKLSSLSQPNAAEQDEIDAAKCQPAHVSHVEPEREPLDWNKPTPFDPFDGYEVSGGGFESYAGPTHALQRFNDGTDALHGSAFLRG